MALDEVDEGLRECWGEEVVEWRCSECNFSCVWWRGAEAFPLCVRCIDSAKRNERMKNAPLPPPPVEERKVANKKLKEDAAVVSFEGVECKASTDKAILVDIEGDEYWIPQSQIHDNSEVWAKGDVGELVISEWIATQKGLI